MPMLGRAKKCLGVFAVLFPKQSRETEKQKTGRKGESRASDYLRFEKGYSIIARNWSQGPHELDIVARDGDVLVFIEVRSRKKTSKVSGYHSITQKKRLSVQKACRSYLNAMKRRAPHFRFDIIEIAHSSSGDTELRHYPSIPLFPKNFH